MNPSLFMRVQMGDSCFLLKQQDDEAVGRQMSVLDLSASSLFGVISEDSGKSLKSLRMNIIFDETAADINNCSLG